MGHWGASSVAPNRKEGSRQLTVPPALGTVTRPRRGTRRSPAGVSVAHHRCPSWI